MLTIVHQTPRFPALAALVLLLAWQAALPLHAQSFFTEADQPAVISELASTVSEPLVQSSTAVAEPASFHGASCPSCQVGSAGGGHAGGLMPGGCGVYGTNLFWCNPFEDLIQDPCGYEPCVNCQYGETPLIFATAELMPLMRDQLDDPVFQTVDFGGPAALDNGDFATEFDAGSRITVGATLTDRYRLESTFMGDYEWSDRAAVRNVQPNELGGTGNLFSPFSNFGIPVGIVGLDYNNYASVEMESSLTSFEVNLRRRLCSRPRLWPHRTYCCTAASFLVGLRYLQLDERFGYVTSSTQAPGGVINRARIDTDNQMWGAQIGMLSQFSSYWEGGWVDWEVKGGIFDNQADLRSAYEQANGAGAVTGSFIGEDSRNRTSFLGEVSLSYNHQVTSSLALRLGYNAFWLTGAALASENLNTNFNVLSQGPAQVNHGGDTVYHGPNLGLTWAF